MWVVILKKPMPIGKDDFRTGFFPRKVRLKEQALALQREVEFKGGRAEIKNVGRSNQK